MSVILSISRQQVALLVAFSDIRYTTRFLLAPKLPHRMWYSRRISQPIDTVSLVLEVSIRLVVAYYHDSPEKTAKRILRPRH
jgi:hypothetical protein